MHILDDPSELSPRAQDFLRRAGRRKPPVRFESPMELWRVPDRDGTLIPAPPELVLGLESFERRFGGLSYDVRYSFAVEKKQPFSGSYQWVYDHYGLDTLVWADPTGPGWFFEWNGEHVAKPCRDLIHTDGSVGTDLDGGSSYLPLAPSVLSLIEDHAVADLVAGWTPWPLAGELAVAVGELLDDLVEVPEASWPSLRWRLSKTVAVMDADSWDRENPRRGAIWSRGRAGRKQVEDALKRASAG
jgi:hypothetical protein